MYARSMLWGTLAVVATALMCGGAQAEPSVKKSAAGEQIVGCETDTKPAGERLYLQTFDGTVDVTGGVAGSPPRATLEVTPGSRTSTCVGFINRTGFPITMDLDAIDVAAGRAGEAAIKLQADSPFGVSSWLAVPDASEVEVAHGQVLWAVVNVDVPADATAGSYYSAIEARAVPLTGDANNTRVAPGVGVQIFFTIPGDAAASGKIVDARAPRVIWWDGLRIGKLPVLDRMRGLGLATIRYSWRNTGDYTDSVGGRVVIESDLGGKDVARFDVDERVVLRQAEREFDVTWSRDIPIVGRFTPTITMRGMDGRTDTVTLDPIWVIPSWTYLAALLIAVGIPLMLRRRSKRRYSELVARVEAAEARSSAESADEDWDDGDEWSDDH